METDVITHLHYLCPRANPHTHIPGPWARLGAAMAAEATTAVHGWPSYHASNLIGPERMIHGRTRGYLKKIIAYQRYGKAKGQVGLRPRRVPYGQTIARAAGGYEATTDRPRGGGT